MSQAAEPTGLDLLELDIDCRLAEIWAQLAPWEGRPMKLADVAVFMRAAYGKGYMDALGEAKPGEMLSEHGYRIPQRKGGKTA